MNSEIKQPKTAKVLKHFKTAGLFASLLLTGCAGMNSSFDCNKVGGLGAGCVSMDDVNDMVNQGAFNNGPPGTKPTAPVSTVTAPYQGATPLPGDPVRYSESIQKIWLAPWQDTGGVYHEPSYVFAVISPGHWVGVPVSAIQTDN